MDKRDLLCKPNAIPDTRVRNIISKVLNIDFPLILISLNAIERLLLL